MGTNLDISKLAGYTYLPSRYRVDGSEKAERLFQDDFMARVRALDENPETAPTDPAAEKFKQFQALVDPANEGKSYCWYGGGTMEEMMLEYDFVPASQGIPNGPDPFTAYYEYVQGDSGGVDAWVSPIIPVFDTRMMGTTHPDGRMTLSGPVLGYFVKKGSQPDFSLTRISIQGVLSIEELQGRLYEQLARTVDGEGGEEGGKDSGSAAANRPRSTFVAEAGFRG